MDIGQSSKLKIPVGRGKPKFRVDSFKFFSDVTFKLENEALDLL